MSMKFDIQKLQRTRLDLEETIKFIKQVLGGPHDEGSSKLQQSQQVLRDQLTFVYTAIAYSREHIHLIGYDQAQQADWLIQRIQSAKYNETLLKKFPEQEWLLTYTFASGFFKVTDSPVDEVEDKVAA